MQGSRKKYTNTMNSTLFCTIAIVDIDGASRKQCAWWWWCCLAMDVCKSPLIMIVERKILNNTCDACVAYVTCVLR